jgi:hypothetical protein
MTSLFRDGICPFVLIYLQIDANTATNNWTSKFTIYLMNVKYLNMSMNSLLRTQT